VFITAVPSTTKLFAWGEGVCLVPITKLFAWGEAGGIVEDMPVCYGRARPGELWPGTYDLRFTFFLFPHNVGIRKAQRGARRWSRGPRQGFPCSLLPGFLSNRGPRSCFAPRTFSRDFRLTIITFLSYETEVGVLNQGFPFSLLQCRQGRTRMDEWVNVMV